MHSAIVFEHQNHVFLFDLGTDQQARNSFTKTISEIIITIYDRPVWANYAQSVEYREYRPIEMKLPIVLDKGNST